MSFLVHRHLSRKRAIKMLTGPLARRWCKTIQDLLYTGGYAKRKPSLNKGQECCPCITLHIPLFLYVQLWVYKLLLKIKLWVWHQCLAPPCHSFLPFRLNSHLDRGGLPSLLILPGLLRSEWGGALCLLLRDTRKMPVAYVGDANPLSWGFIGFAHKPSYSASFLHYFPTTVFLPNLSLHL